MFSDDDNIAIIGLWIIAIGFVVLAIDKTTRLNNGSQNQVQIQPPPSNQQNTPQPEDEQFKQIQMQLQQLKNGISELKKKSQT